ncbi:uncharacterized protein C12orf71 homolog [Sarcophilus harrisii]|uniref:Uncharacterized protein n=1 Tax=Sarcophilus harrisii TaxID=9305 RepID=A0A7N4PR76_SARHA|nr:uncharacterized protein C12orf71 homolog [Sarcophilus harrisii]
MTKPQAMRSDPFDTMASSSSQNDSTDTEISSSESNFSLSVGYFPSQETNSYEETSPESDTIHFLPPIQGAWLTKSTGRMKGRHSQAQISPEQFSKLSITLAWDIDLGPDQSDTVTDWDLKKENDWTDMKQEQNIHGTMRKLDCFAQKLETNIQKEDNFIPESLLKEDSHIITVPPLETTKTTTKSIQEENMSQDSPVVQLLKNRHLVQEVMPQELRGTKEMETPSYKDKRTCSGESSSLSTGKREYQPPPSSGIQLLSCLNIGRLLRWLREQVISSLSGREQSQNRATEGTKLTTSKRQRSFRERRVQPQDTPKSTNL